MRMIECRCSLEISSACELTPIPTSFYASAIRYVEPLMILAKADLHNLIVPQVQGFRLSFTHLMSILIEPSYIRTSFGSCRSCLYLLSTIIIFQRDSTLICYFTRNGYFIRLPIVRQSFHDNDLPICHIE